MSLRSAWRYRHTVLVLCTFSYFATRVLPVTISPLIPDITSTFNTSEAVIGSAITGLWAAYAIVQLPSGTLADRVGERRLIVLALLFAVTGSVLMAFSPNLVLFFLFTVLLGAGVGVYYNVGVLLIAREFKHTGRAIGIHRTGGHAAGLLAPLVAVSIAGLYDWRAALAACAVAALPAIGLVAWRIRPTSPRTGASGAAPSLDRSLLGRFARRTNLYLLSLAAIGEFAAIANMTFLPTFFIAFKGIEPATASILFSLYFVLLGVGHPLFGWVSDHVSTDGVVGLSAVIGISSHAMLVTASSFPLLVLATSLAGVAMGFMSPLQAEFIDVQSRRSRGANFGLFRTVYILIGSLGSVVTGGVAHFAGWSTAYWALSGLFVTTLLLVIYRSSGHGIPGRIRTRYQ